MQSNMLVYRGYPVTVSRSMRVRRTITVKDGRIYFNAGLLDSDSQVLEMLRAKDRWIMKRLTNPLMKVSFEIGKTTSVVYLGRRIGVQFEPASRGRIELHDTFMTIYGPSETAMMKAFRDFAAGRLDELIDGFMREIAPVGDFHLSYRFYASRWGCCFKDRRDVILNVWCIGLPVEGIKYVFCHELAHLKVANHQKQFYNELARIWPGYRQGLKLTKSFVIK